MNKEGNQDEEWYDATFWLDNAEVLSESDLINAVRGFQGKKEMLPKERKYEDIYPFDFKTYFDFVKAHPCVTCGGQPVDAHHFPRSKGAGGDDEYLIPLCRKCHSEEHQDSFDFLWLYKDKIFKYFYDTFLDAYEIKKNNE